MLLPDVLAAVQLRVEFLRAEPWLPEGDGWLLADTLLASPSLLDEAIDLSTAGQGGGDRQVGASLFAQSYAFQVAAIPLAAYALGLRAPTIKPSVVMVRLAKGRANGVSFADRLGDPLLPAGVTAAVLVSDLIGRHLTPFVAAIHERVKIGERLLWGNVAAASAMSFRAVEGAARNRGDDDERRLIREQAERFFTAADPWLVGLGQFDVASGSDLNDWNWTRTSCCLWFRSSGGQLCQDCSLRRE